MNVKLIGITKSLIEVDNKELSPEELISYVARVSNPSNQENLSTAPKLLKYLINHQHWSPLELVQFTVEIETSRAIAQQILRHRSFTFQEFSQRYAQALTNEKYEPRRQDVKNRQNSIDDLPELTKKWFTHRIQSNWNQAYSDYEQALNMGISKESARFLLPLSTSTKLYMSGSVRSWIHYLELRTSPDTQLEHRKIAVEIKNNIFKPNFPSISEALGW